MTHYEIEQAISKEEADLEVATGCDEETACFIFGADSKADVINCINEQLDFYKGLLESEYEDEGMDYDALCMVQGLSRYA